MERLKDTTTRWLVQKLSARRPDETKRHCPTYLTRITREVNRYIIPGLGNLTVENLTKRDVQRWRDALAETYRTKTVNGALRTLRNVLKSETDNASAALVPSLTEDDSRTTEDAPNLLSETELMQVLEVFRDVFPGHYALVLVLATTAMRISTALALEWIDIDVERGIIHARRRRSGKTTVPGVKRSRTAKDTPPLLAHVLAVLNEHKQGLNGIQVQSGLVFPNEVGGYRARSVLNKPMKRALAICGIKKRVTPSTGFRRTAVVLYRNAADSAVAQDIAGHLTLAMHRHYGPSQDMEKQNAGMTAFGSILGKKEEK